MFDTETGNVASVSSVYRASLAGGFSDGTMIIQRRSGGTRGHLGDICSVDRNGTVTALSAEGNLLAAGANGFLTDSNGLSFYTKSGELVWSFSTDEIAYYTDGLFIIRHADSNGVTYLIYDGVGNPVQPVLRANEN